MKSFSMFCAALLVTASEGFSPLQTNTDSRVLRASTRSSTKLKLVSSPPPPRDDNSANNDAPRDYNPEEEFNLDDNSNDSQIDWDSEWKKVVRDQQTGKGSERPDGGYKSEAEIAAIRAANKATEQLNRAAENVPSLPTWDTLKGDWKFWIGLIAAISVATSLLAAQGINAPPPPTSSGGSYYI